MKHGKDKRIFQLFIEVEIRCVFQFREGNCPLEGVVGWYGGRMRGDRKKRVERNEKGKGVTLASRLSNSGYILIGLVE